MARPMEWQRFKPKRRLLKDNGLSIVLAILFATFLAGSVRRHRQCRAAAPGQQAVSGWLHYNQEQNEHAQPGNQTLGVPSNRSIWRSRLRELGESEVSASGSIVI